MIVDNHLEPFVAPSEESLLYCLRKIDANSFRIVFLVTQEGILEGVLSDGDIRRWLLKSKSADLTQDARLAAPKEFVSFRYSEEGIRRARERLELEPQLSLIPLVDERNQLAAVLRVNRNQIQIGNKLLGEHQPAFLIAEVGNNHNGSLERAKKLIDLALRAGADCVKFQHRNMAALYSNSGNPNDAAEDLGAQYTLDLLSKFQLSRDDLFRTFDYCKKVGIPPLCTPWDLSSLEDLRGYGLEAFKIASADLTNLELIGAAVKIGKPLICSTGMSSDADIHSTAQFLINHGAQFAFLHCNSTYPAPFRDLNLKFLPRLKELGGDCIVGYSSHDRGIYPCVASIAMGAKIIEKHITLDRELEGNDHKVSLLPDEFRELVQAVRTVEDSLGDGKVRRLSQGEMINREVLGKSLVARRDLAVGEVIREEDLDIRGPGKGLRPNRRGDLTGRPAKRAFKKGDFFFESDLLEFRGKPRDYKFTRPFGIPIRYHDFENLARRSNFNLVEFHFSYKDVDNIDPAQFIKESQAIDLVVHAPENFAGDFVLDFSSSDKAVVQRSTDEIKKVIERTRQLRKFFPQSARTRIVTNVGGATADGFLSEKERAPRYANLEKALAQFNADDVEIIPQSMPPFPWHFGGQRYHNLLVHPKEIADFCTRTKMRICLDVSHAQLACNHLKLSILDYIATVAPHVAHLHLADAKDVDGEGLQIGEGTSDYVAISRALREHAPKASFIPEIWQGHKNDGEGFWIAFERLEPSL